MNLNTIGWNDNWQAKMRTVVDRLQDEDDPAADRVIPGRIGHEHRLGYRVWTESGIHEAMLPSGYKHKAMHRADWPAVGDWIALRLPSEDSVDDAMVVEVLPRRSRLVRIAAGNRTEDQILAANIDTVFIVMGLEADFNLRRLERYLAIVADSGAEGIIILNKTDLCDDVAACEAAVAELAGSLPIYTMSALRGTGVDSLHQYCRAGQTIAIIGSSGVGKSTLINDILGEDRQDTQEVRANDSKGRHTTVSRDLIVLPQGGMIIDNPGIREIQLASDEDALEEAFADVIEIMTHCRFRDCTHDHEPGCAVQDAIASETLDVGRLGSYYKLRDEIIVHQKKREQRAQAEARRKKQSTRNKKTKKRSR